MSQAASLESKPKRVLLLGATGTIGQAVAKALHARGHNLVCFVRPEANAEIITRLEKISTVRTGSVLKKESLAEQGFCNEPFDAVMSCLASRTGVAKEAWAIDHQAHLDALGLATRSGVTQFVLLSAICVQRPKLAFQHAKLAFEKELIASGLTYSIVRPTAFFKSLSGQVERVKAGKPYMMFGDGELTACKPISDDDLATYLADCLDRDELKNQILPIGGPGPAITPKQQGEFLFSLLGQPARLQKVPPTMLKWIARILSVLSRLYPPLAERAEYARIGHYYATESMLLLDQNTGEYREDLTPSTGQTTLFDHYRKLVANELDSPSP